MPRIWLDERTPMFGVLSCVSSTVTVSLPAPPSIVSCARISFASPLPFHRPGIVG